MIQDGDMSFWAKRNNVRSNPGGEGAPCLGLENRGWIWQDMGSAGKGCIYHAKGQYDPSPCLRKLTLVAEGHVDWGEEELDLEN